MEHRRLRNLKGADSAITGAALPPMAKVLCIFARDFSSRAARPDQTLTARKCSERAEEGVDIVKTNFLDLGRPESSRDVHSKNNTWPLVCRLSVKQKLPARAPC